ncbi:MAG TPA: FMN-binding protein [Prolixibacteraceae bacterium]|nr:FMN-binding protein [Prolixibacteraceae bacterium]HPR59919.1 FMN-binding protein [Prolixibacteraceae bacterium]
MIQLLILTWILIAGAVQQEQPCFDETLKRRAEKALISECGANVVHYELIAENARTLLFTLYADSLQCGYVAITSSMGRSEKFEYLVMYSNDVAVQRISILQYRSSRGTGITSKRWLKQFVGNKGEVLTYGKDVQAISGATFSAQSLTHDIPILSKWVSEQINK